MNVTPKWPILAGLALILVSGAIQPAYSAATALLTLTETSSTNLTATLANVTPTPITLTVMSPTPDVWILTLPTGYMMGPPGARVFWLEPDSSEINQISAFPQALEFAVTSETPCSIPCTANPNHTQVTITNGLIPGVGVAPVDLAVVFDDDGDVATAPEPSTLSLVVLAALVSIIGFRRKLGSLLGAAARN